MAETALEFANNYLVRGRIVCITGIHVGGVAESMKIGGTDSPVIMNRMTNLPFIPGSSIKGKMRSLLELKYGGAWLDAGGDVHGSRNSCQDPECDLCVTFGRSASNNVMSGPTRLIVRDAHPLEATRSQWGTNEDILHGTEIKGENYLNRITSKATPRFIERVPAGSEFDLEMVFSVYNPRDASARLKLVFEAMSLLEDNYLGGSGSRGYGKVAFREIELLRKTREDYATGGEWVADDRTAGAGTAREIMARL